MRTKPVIEIKRKEKRALIQIEKLDTDFKISVSGDWEDEDLYRLAQALPRSMRSIGLAYSKPIKEEV